MKVIDALVSFIRDRLASVLNVIIIDDRHQCILEALHCGTVLRRQISSLFKRAARNHSRINTHEFLISIDTSELASWIDLDTDIGVDRIFSGVHFFPQKKLTTFLVVALKTQAKTTK